jgi:hypothetical protein
MFNSKTHQKPNRQAVDPVVLTLDQLELVAGGFTGDIAPPVGSIGPTPRDPIGPIGPVMPISPIPMPIHIKMPVV